MAQTTTLRGPGWSAPLLAALALTLANTAKPLVIDDAAYVAYARQILAHPADPYGFEILWFEGPEPAFHVLAPPVLPYWLAAAMALFGDEPVHWKLALLPFALALAFSLRSLFARFAAGLETPLLWLAMLSPSVLPFVNLMLDVPSLALGLSALALFLAASERGRPSVAVAAGCLAGLAAQTKYTAATTVAAMLLYGALYARWRLALLAAASALAVFGGWEALMTLRYGQPHLLAIVERLATDGRGPWFASALLWATGLLALLGALALPAGLTGLVGLGMGPGRVGAFGLAAALALAAIANLPIRPLRPPPLWPRLHHPPPELVLLTGLGLGTALVVAAVAVRRLRSAPSREDVFLTAWLAVEVAAFFVLSPFLAGRRVIGISLTSLLLCGRAAASTLAAGGSRGALRVGVAAGAALGLFLFASEVADARAGRDAVRRTTERLAELGADPSRETLWFVGHWGFQFYAARGGWSPILPGRSLLRAGDWVIVPEGVPRQSLDLAPLPPALAEVAARSPLPWSTIPWSYIGPTALRRRAEALIRVRIHRVAKDVVLLPPGPS